MSLLLPLADSYLGLLKPSFFKQTMFSESESSIIDESVTFPLPELTCKDYRKLPWDMPVSTPKSSDVDKKSGRIPSETTMIKPPKHVLPVRSDDYFRSLYAIHFCHKPELLRDYNVRGVRERDFRRRQILGDVYYCINHPPHYRILETRLQNVYETAEELKARARRVDCTFKTQDTKELDPVLCLPPASDLGRSDIFEPRRIKVTKLPVPAVPLFSSEDLMEQPNTDTDSPKASVRKLYKQAKAVLEHIHLPTGEQPETVPAAGFLRTLYTSNKLATFEAYENMSETSESLKAATNPDSLAEVTQPVMASAQSESRRDRLRKMF